MCSSEPRSSNRHADVEGMACGGSVEFGTRNTEPKTQNPEHETRDSENRTPNSKLQTPNSKLQTETTPRPIGHPSREGIFYVKPSRRTKSPLSEGCPIGRGVFRRMNEFTAGVSASL